MIESLIFALGGLIGSALKAWASNSQETFSRKSIIDVILGGLIGILWPLVGPIPLPKNANLLQQAALIAFISYSGSHLLTNVADKLGLKT